MKKQLFMTSLILLAFSGFANAETICGVLTAKILRPNCAPGRACPAHMNINYVLTQENQETLVLSIQDYEIFAKVENAVDKKVCAEGERDATSFQVTSISVVE